MTPRAGRHRGTGREAEDAGEHGRGTQGFWMRPHWWRGWTMQGRGAPAERRGRMLTAQGQRRGGPTRGAGVGRRRQRDDEMR